jgi:hypothetical protein
MSGALRRIAPALLVGGAAVVVVGAADPGIAALVSGDDGSPTVAESTTRARSDGSSQSGTVDQSRTTGDTDSGGEDDDGGDSDSVAGSGGDDEGTSATAAGACTVPEVTGPIVQTEWGLVQVAAQVTDGRVCAVRTIMTPDGDRKSVSINARAVPELEAAVVAAGDASFDNISGATVTSDGYRESLQSIIDQQ